MNEREMYGELNALLGAIGKALDIEAELAARAIEQGEIVIEMSEDDRGERFLSVRYRGRVAKVYQGAVRHAPQPPLK